MSPVFRLLRLRFLETAVNALNGAAGRRRRALAGHLVTGQRGERTAFFWLRRHGYTVVARGWRSSRARGDIDLIAWQGDTLCFIEVKTRTTRAVAPAWFAVDREKRYALRRLARHYLRRLPSRDASARFDILAIYFEEGRAAEFELFTDAFFWQEA